MQQQQQQECVNTCATMTSVAVSAADEWSSASAAKRKKLCIFDDDELDALQNYSEPDWAIVTMLLHEETGKLMNEEMQCAAETIRKLDRAFAKQRDFQFRLGEFEEHGPEFVFCGTAPYDLLPSTSVDPGYVIFETAFMTVSTQDTIPRSLYGFDGIVMKIDISDVGFIRLADISAAAGCAATSSGVMKQEILVDRNVQLIVSKDLPKRHQDNPYACLARYIECKAIPSPAAIASDYYFELAASEL